MTGEQDQMRPSSVQRSEAASVLALVRAQVQTSPVPLDVAVVVVVAVAAAAVACVVQRIAACACRHWRPRQACHTAEVASSFAVAAAVVVGAPSSFPSEEERYCWQRRWE